MEKESIKYVAESCASKLRELISRNPFHIPSEQTKIAEQLKSFYLNYHPDLIVMNASAGLFALKNKSYIEKVIREVEVFLCISDGML